LKKNPTLKSFFPEDKIAFSFSAIIILIQIYYFVTGFIKELSTIIIPFISLLVLLIIINFQYKFKSKSLKFIRSYLHIPFYGIIFTAFQSFVHKLNPNDYDLLLLNWDLSIFGFDITRWLELYIAKWLTEVLTLSYFSYYILPTLTFILLFFSRNNESFLRVRNYLLSIVIGWYGAFVFYLLLPAAGPDIAFPENYRIHLLGLSPITNTYLQKVSQYLKESFVRNTFPSMHFGIILITNYFAFKYKRNYFWFCTMPLGIMLGIATLYLRQHYLIDLAASFPIAIASIYAAISVNNKYYKKENKL